MTDQAGIASALKAAMRRMPATVALVTTLDPATGQRAGLAASAVIPVSMEPPSMLVSINRSASAHLAIERAGRYCINLLGEQQTALVALFSNGALREQRFSSEAWQFAHDLPFLPSACANIFCRVEATLVHGTHELFVGAVEDVRTAGADAPLGWLEGDFARLAPLE